jgi:hypothetical protein
MADESARAELVEQAGLLCWRSGTRGEVVQAMGSLLVVVCVERRLLTGGPRVGGGGVGVLSTARTDGLGERDPGDLHEIALGGRLGVHAGRLSSGLAECRVDVGRVVELDELSRRFDDFGLIHSPVRCRGTGSGLNEVRGDDR